MGIGTTVNSGQASTGCRGIAQKVKVTKEYTSDPFLDVTNI